MTKGRYLGKRKGWFVLRITRTQGVFRQGEEIEAFKQDVLPRQKRACSPN